MGPRSEDVASVSRDEARAQEEVCLCVRALCVECEGRKGLPQEVPRACHELGGPACLPLHHGSACGRIGKTGKGDIGLEPCPQPIHACLFACM